MHRVYIVIQPKTVPATFIKINGSSLCESTSTDVDAMLPAFHLVVLKDAIEFHEFSHAQCFGAPGNLRA